MNNAAVAHAGALRRRNCNALLGVIDGKTPVNFCPNFEHDTLNHPPTFWKFVHEFITHYVVPEGKLWEGLVLLFFKPADQQEAGEVVPNKALANVGKELQVTAQENHLAAEPIPAEVMEKGVTTSLECGAEGAWCTWLQTHLTQIATMRYGAIGLVYPMLLGLMTGAVIFASIVI